MEVLHFFNPYLTGQYLQHYIGYEIELIFCWIIDILRVHYCLTMDLESLIIQSVCKCKGLKSSQYRKLKLATNKICDQVSYSRQVCWGEHWTKCRGQSKNFRNFEFGATRNAIKVTLQKFDGVKSIYINLLKFLVKLTQKTLLFLV